MLVLSKGLVNFQLIVILDDALYCFFHPYFYRKRFECDDAFIGFNNDTCASIIIEMYRVLPNEMKYQEKVIIF